MARRKTRLRGYAERMRLLQKARDGLSSSSSIQFNSSFSESEEESYHIVVEPRKSGLIPFRKKKLQPIKVKSSEGEPTNAAISTPLCDPKYAVSTPFRPMGDSFRNWDVSKIANARESLQAKSTDAQEKQPEKKIKVLNNVTIQGPIAQATAPGASGETRKGDMAREEKGIEEQNRKVKRGSKAFSKSGVSDAGKIAKRPGKRKSLFLQPTAIAPRKRQLSKMVIDLQRDMKEHKELLLSVSRAVERNLNVDRDVRGLTQSLAAMSTVPKSSFDRDVREILQNDMEELAQCVPTTRELSTVQEKVDKNKSPSPRIPLNMHNSIDKISPKNSPKKIMPKTCPEDNDENDEASGVDRKARRMNVEASPTSAKPVDSRLRQLRTESSTPKRESSLATTVLPPPKGFDSTSASPPPSRPSEMPEISPSFDSIEVRLAQSGLVTLSRYLRKRAHGGGPDAAPSADPISVRAQETKRKSLHDRRSKPKRSSTRLARKEVATSVDAVLNDWETESEREPRLEAKTRSHYARADARETVPLFALCSPASDAAFIEAEVRRLQGKIAPGKSLAFQASPVSARRCSEPRNGVRQPASRHNATDDSPLPRATASPVFPVSTAVVVAPSPQIILNHDDERSNTRDERAVEKTSSTPANRDLERNSGMQSRLPKDEEQIEKLPKPALRSKAPKSAGKRGAALVESGAETKKQKTQTETLVVAPAEQQVPPTIPEPDVRGLPADAEEENNNVPTGTSAIVSEGNDEVDKQADVIQAVAEAREDERDGSASKKEKKHKHKKEKKHKKDKKRKKDKEEKREKKERKKRQVWQMTAIDMEYHPVGTTRCGRTIKPTIYTRKLQEAAKAMQDAEAVKKKAKAKQRPAAAAVVEDNDARDVPAEGAKAGASGKRPKAAKSKSSKVDNALLDRPPLENAGKLRNTMPGQEEDGTLTADKRQPVVRGKKKANTGKKRDAANTQDSESCPDGLPRNAALDPGPREHTQDVPDAQERNEAGGTRTTRSGAQRKTRKGRNDPGPSTSSMDSLRRADAPPGLAGVVLDTPPSECTARDINDTAEVPSAVEPCLQTNEQTKKSQRKESPATDARSENAKPTRSRRQVAEGEEAVADASLPRTRASANLSVDDASFVLMCSEEYTLTDANTNFECRFMPSHSQQSAMLVSIKPGKHYECNNVPIKIQGFIHEGKGSLWYKGRHRTLTKSATFVAQAHTSFRLDNTDRRNCLRIFLILHRHT